MGGVSYCYAIVRAASSGLRYTELSRAPPPCACERLVTFVHDWRGVRYGAVAGTTVGGVSYFHAIVAAALSGMSY